MHMGEDRSAIATATATPATASMVQTCCVFIKYVSIATAAAASSGFGACNAAADAARCLPCMQLLDIQ